MSVPKNYGCLIEEIEKDMSEDGKRAAEKYFKHKWDNSVQMQWYARGFDEARAPLVDLLKKSREELKRLYNKTGNDCPQFFCNTPLAKRLDAALAGTGEKEALAGRTGNNNKGDKCKC